MLTDEQIQELNKNVERGAVFLDEKRPGWWMKIADAKLDMGTCTLCVLGQLFGSFEAGLCRMNLNPRDQIKYGFAYGGFDAPSESDAFSKSRREYAVLTTAWRREIDKRRLADVADAPVPMCGFVIE